MAKNKTARESVNTDAVAQPEVAQPEVSQPEVAQPEVAQPEVAQPEVAQPEVAQPEEEDIPALLLKPSGLSVTKIPVLRKDVALRQCVAIPELNKQRQGYAHVCGATATEEGRLVVESMSENGWLPEKGAPTLELYSDALHGHLYIGALEYAEKCLMGEVLRHKDSDNLRKAATAAMEIFRREHKPNNRWKRPKFIVDTANSRWFSHLVANGYREVNKQPLIDVVPCVIYCRNLTVEERNKEQILENLPDGKQEPSYYGFARSIHQICQDRVAHGLPAPISLSEYSKLVAQTTSQRLQDDTTKKNNLISGTRPLVVLATMFPQLKLFERIDGPKDGVDGMTSLTYTGAFAQAKASQFTELMMRIVPSARMTENLRRKKKCETDGKEYISATDLRHGRELERMISENVICPFTKDPIGQTMELTSPTVEEVSGIINGSGKKKATLATNAASLLDGIGTADTASKQKVSAIVADVLSGRVDSLQSLQTDYGSVIDAAAAFTPPPMAPGGELADTSTYTPAEWLTAISRTQVASHDALWEHIASLPQVATKEIVTNP